MTRTFSHRLRGVVAGSARAACGATGQAARRLAQSAGHAARRLARGASDNPGRRLARRAAAGIIPLAAIALLVVAMGGTWSVASAAPGYVPATGAGTVPPHGSAIAPLPARTTPDGGEAPRTVHFGHKELTGKLNLNTATEEQLMLLPAVGPAKADRIVAWRKKNGSFKRPADLRRVKGFGYKTFKRLEPFLDIKGDTTLAEK